MVFNANGYPASLPTQIPRVTTDVVRLWQGADAVCFDVDSTVTQEEGIDKLAERAGRGDEVAKLTAKAMGGDMSFRTALDLRLKAIQPTAELVRKVAAEPVPLTPGVEHLVKLIHGMGKHVFLVSGGFRSMIQPVAETLGIQEDHIYANEILFDESGNYAGFSLEEPTSDKGGKARAVTEIMRRFSVGNVVMVGDGATDMEAKPPACLTVGFGGNIIRDPVKALADLFVYDFQVLIDMLEAQNHVTLKTSVSSCSIASTAIPLTVDSLPILEDELQCEQTIVQLWLEADAVCFDVDSTVTQEEGIDKLAERAGKGDEVAKLTAQAMGGDMSFRTALDLRLRAIKPTESLVCKVAAEPVPLTPGIVELVQCLHGLGKHVFLVSGGFRSMIQPVAETLGIQADHVYANEILFDSFGDYAGFCHDEPTSNKGGKARAVAEIMQRFSVEKVVMVGDGATDMEAKPPARLTIGFGGNVVREKVQELADLYVYDMGVLTDMLRDTPRSQQTDSLSSDSS